MKNKDIPITKEDFKKSRQPQKNNFKNEKNLKKKMSKKDCLHIKFKMFLPNPFHQLQCLQILSPSFLCILQGCHG